MRKVLECAVVEQVCGKIQTRDVERLRENIQMQYFFFENFNPDKLRSLDNAFHQILFAAARTPLVFSMPRTISIRLVRTRG